MSSAPHQPDPRDQPPERTFEDVLNARLHRRRERAVQQIQRNRKGGHRIPTWVLATILGLLLLGWLYLIFFG
ncbi:hypothetical protein [Actinoplanes sp. RD1]|uniref:hypothetical protein n=1 Tax=Actinoplanes sp. RD1 TaxID=3064538 RepID=UPI00274281F5|nr:hypothetical protein [Actinoplanes sp. RD1]